MAELLVVGVTGHRPNRLPATERTRVMKDLDQVLAGFEPKRRGRKPVLLTALAEGADRWAAHAALKRKWKIWAILPFSKERYLKDFAELESREEFEALLAAASEKTESPEADRLAVAADAYHQMGMSLVARSGALVAIWDGAPAHGKGGTLDIIAAAKVKSIPVIWIHAVQAIAPMPLTSD